MRAVAVFWVWLGLLLSTVASANDPVSARHLAFQHKLESRYPTVRHLSPSDFPEQHTGVVVFDVREVAEFGVSHLEHAVRVSPDTTAARFFDQFGEMIEGKLAVFYCSVGARSSDLIARITALRPSAASQLVNLEGGLFDWHNAAKPLVDRAGPTDAVHPYSAFWVRYLRRREHLRWR